MLLATALHKSAGGWHVRSIRKKLWVGAILIGLFSTWVALDSRLATGQDSYAAADEGLNDYYEVFEIITQDYFQALDPQELTESSIDGMLGILDPYTQFFDPRALEQLKIDTQGKFGGLGITISVSRRHDVPVVRSVIEGTPADTSGLLMGDRIVGVNGDSTKGKPLAEVVDVLRGDPGEPVTVTIEREGLEEWFDQVVVRDRIGINSVLLAEEVSPGIGYISLSSVFGGTTSRFSQNTGRELEAALRNLQKIHPKGIVLDLRSNPGGLLEQAIEVTDKFLPPNQVVVSTKGRSGNQNREYRTHDEALLEGVPLVVLVNGHSASASEIVAGAIQDSDRGLILGTPTFGKGSVQTVRHIGGAKALKLTTAVYYTPSGRSIHKGSRRMRRSGGPVITLNDTLRLAGFEVLSILGSAEGREDAVDELIDRYGMTSEQATQVADMQLAQMVGLGSPERIGPKGSDPEQMFKTAGGRTVYGGGGITPDVEVTPVRLSRYFLALRGAGYLFDFAVVYAAQNDLPESFESFDVDDSILEAFRVYVNDPAQVEHLNYRSVAQLRMSALEESLSETGLSETASKAVEMLKGEVEQEREKEFELAREWIRRELRNYICIRKWGARATILSQLKGDKQFEEAVRILNEPEAYRGEMKVAMK